MTGFPINPPRARIANPDGTVTNEWYRFFGAIQKLIGSGESDPFDDSLLFGAAVAMHGEDRIPDQFPAYYVEPGTLTAGTALSGGGHMGNNLTVDLEDTAVTPATYGSDTQVGQFTVDQQGRITFAADVAISATGIGAALATTTMTAGAGLTGGGDLSANRTFDVGAGTGITVNADDIAITATGVVAAAYGSASTVGTFTVNAQGQLTAAADVAIAISAAAVTSGTLAVARGGTNIGSYTTGDILYASAATTLSALADVATGNSLISGGVGVAPSWGKIGLTTHISGTLAVGNGGSGGTTFTANKYLKGNGTSAFASGAITDDGTTITVDSGVGFSIARTAVTSPAAGDGNVYSGTYTPTLTNGTNVAASTESECQYMRVGSVVTVSGRVQIDTTATGAFDLDMSIPIASNFTGSTQAGGTFYSSSADMSGAIFSDGTDDRVTFQGSTTTANARNCWFSFTYQIL